MTPEEEEAIRRIKEAEENKSVELDAWRTSIPDSPPARVG
jgi:hypothetical protein